MKTKTTIVEITHDDLVDLFSTAVYGSEWLAIQAPEGKGLAKDGDCREDVWARTLLAGKSVIAWDCYAEGVSYGSLPHQHDKEGDSMGYTITLEDIKTGIQKCLDSDEEYLRDYVNDYIKGDGDMDLPEAEAIMQVIMFGEVVYG